MSTSVTHVSRRKLLALLPAAGLPLLSSEPASAQEPYRQLLISPADSVFYYRLLLERVHADANSALGEVPARQVEECSDLLQSLKADLSELRNKLKRAKSSAGISRLEVHLEALERNVALMQRRAIETTDPLRVGSIPIANGVLIELVRDATKDCDLDRKGEIRALLDKILERLDENNQKMEQYSHSLDEYWKSTDRVSDLITENEHRLEEVGLLLSDVFNGDREKYSSQAPGVIKSQELLRRVIHDLKGLEVFRNTRAKGALISLLDATDTALGKPAGLLETSYHSSTSWGWNEPQPFIPFDQTSLISRVRAIVMTQGYFKWRTFIQVANCIAVCTPIWVSYSGAGNKDLRRRLIGEALEYAVWGVLEIEKVAAALADVY